MYKLLICSCLIAHFFFTELEACTTFLLKQDSHLLVTKSFDWVLGEGLVVVNKRQIAKQAMTLDQPMRWVSRYGSISFTQAGRELPMGGMNEAGLVIELMWLEGTTYPPSDSRSTVSELQWIQYQLDTASCVDEVIASDQFLRIDRNSKSSLHFLIADRAGKYAVIEFIDGRTVVYRDAQMPALVLTNSSYQESIEFLKKHRGFGGELCAAEGDRSRDRFVRIASQLQEFSLSCKKADQAAALHILSSVVRFDDGVDERSQWNIVYDVSAKEIHFLTAKHQKMRTIRLDSFDFAGNTPVDVLDIQAKLQGDVHDDFRPYTYDINRKLIDHYYDKIPFLKAISSEIREWIARYPETTYYQPNVTT